jgi:hypothetical protein
VPYETIHYLVVQGGGARYASPVETQLLGGSAEPSEKEIQQHAETVADLIIAGLSIDVNLQQ